MSSFRFLKKTDYGLIMVALLSRRGVGELMSVAEMQELGLPRSFLVKIARDLIKLGILGAKEGRGGGYFLKKGADKISLKQVVVALEGEVSTTSCAIGKRKCPIADKCPHKHGMQRLTRELSEVLERYSVADLNKIEG